MKSQSLPVPPGMVKKFRCAFFNFSAEVGNQTGGWSYRGVETHVINSTHVRCNAFHLTSFAVLVSIVPSVGEPVSGDVWTAKLDRKCMTALLQYVLIPLYIYSTSCFNISTFSLSLQPALDYISYIGCSISLLCLLASIIFYLALR